MTGTVPAAAADVNARIVPTSNDREDPTPVMSLATSMHIRHTHTGSERNTANAIAALRLMLAARAAVNAQANNGSTVLHRALLWGAQSGFVGELLSAGVCVGDAV